MLCDGCGGIEVTKENRHHLFVHTASFRVNTVRCWAFCSDACRDDWWSTGDTSDFLATKTPADLAPSVTVVSAANPKVHIKHPPEIAGAQTVMLSFSSSTDFMATSDTEGDLGSGTLAETDWVSPKDPAITGTHWSGWFNAPGAAPSVHLHTDTAFASGDTITIGYKGNAPPPLYDDPAEPADADPQKLDRDLVLSVYRQQLDSKTELVQRRNFKRPAPLNKWWKDPQPEAEKRISQKTALTRGPR